MTDIEAQLPAIDRAILQRVQAGLPFGTLFNLGIEIAKPKKVLSAMMERRGISSIYSLQVKVKDDGIIRAKIRRPARVEIVSDTMLAVHARVLREILYNNLEHKRGIAFDLKPVMRKAGYTIAPSMMQRVVDELNCWQHPTIPYTVNSVGTVQPLIEEQHDDTTGH